MNNKHEKLSAAELAELEAALGDGYFDNFGGHGDRHEGSEVTVPMPDSIPQGLTPLSIRFRVPPILNDEGIWERDDCIGVYSAPSELSL